MQHCNFLKSNTGVSHCGINLKKIIMSQSVTATLLICVSTWLGHTSLSIIFNFALFYYFFENGILNHQETHVKGLVIKAKVVGFTHRSRRLAHSIIINVLKVGFGQSIQPIGPSTSKLSGPIRTLEPESY